MELAVRVLWALLLRMPFPTAPPNSGFLGRVKYSMPSSQAPRGLDQDATETAVIRRPLSLGKLMMMSRRRRDRRKAVQIRKQNLSTEMVKKRDSACCNFKTSIDIIEGLEWKTFQPGLKFL